MLVYKYLCNQSSDLYEISNLSLRDNNGLPTFTKTNVTLPKKSQKPRFNSHELNAHHNSAKHCLCSIFVMELWTVLMDMMRIPHFVLQVILYIWQNFIKKTPKKNIGWLKKTVIYKYQPSSEGGTHSPPLMPHHLYRHTTCNAAPPATPHHLQSRTTCKIQNRRQGSQNGRRGLERCVLEGFAK